MNESMYVSPIIKKNGRFPLICSFIKGYTISTVKLDLVIISTWTVFFEFCKLKWLVILGMIQHIPEHYLRSDFPMPAPSIANV